MKKVLGMCLAGMAAFLTACTPGADNTAEEGSEETLSVVTTFYPVYEFTQQVAGETADVSMVIPAGTDSHGFEPSAQDVAQISEADVFVYSSPEMETWVEDLLTVIESEDVVVVEAAEAIELRENETEEDHDHEHGDHDHDHAHDEGGHHHVLDPHVWLDPVHAQQQVETIRDGLIQADPENESVYMDRSAAFTEELDGLHQEFTAAFSDAENRTFITQHAAFGYLAERYGLDQVSIGGLSTEVEPSPARLAEISSLIQEQNLPVVYYNQSESSAIAETVAEEAGTETAQLHSLEGVSEEERAQGEDYLSIMRQNLESLTRSIR